MDRFIIRYNKYQYRNLEFVFVDEDEFNKIKEDIKHLNIFEEGILGETEHYRWWCKNAGAIDNKNSILKPISIEDKYYSFDGIYYINKNYGN